jgi:hypothetical protein
MRRKSRLTNDVPMVRHTALEDRRDSDKQNAVDGEVVTRLLRPSGDRLGTTLCSGRQDKKDHASKHGLPGRSRAGWRLSCGYRMRSIGSTFRHPARSVTSATRVAGELLLRANHTTRRLPGGERRRRDDYCYDHSDRNQQPSKRAKANHALQCPQLYTAVTSHSSSCRAVDGPSDHPLSLRLPTYKNCILIVGRRRRVHLQREHSANEE